MSNIYHFSEFAGQFWHSIYQLHNGRQFIRPVRVAGHGLGGHPGLWRTVTGHLRRRVEAFSHIILIYIYIFNSIIYFMIFKNYKNSDHVHFLFRYVISLSQRILLFCLFSASFNCKSFLYFCTKLRKLIQLKF